MEENATGQVTYTFLSLLYSDPLIYHLCIESGAAQSRRGKEQCHCLSFLVQRDGAVAPGMLGSLEEELRSTKAQAPT